MKRLLALIVALALGVAVAAGTFAVMRTTQLAKPAAASRVSAAEVARQTRALDRAEAALRAQLRRKPPAIPAGNAAPAAPQQTVIYRRPAPVVHVVHRHGDDGSERDGQEGNDD